MTNFLRIAMAQINTTVGDFSGNREKVLQAISQARQKKAQLVLFPELTLTGYPPEDMLFKENFITDNSAVLHSILPHTKGIAIVLGYVDRDPKGHLYNAAAFISNGKIFFNYRKIELPNYGVFDEKRYFTPAHEPGLLRWDQKKLALTICEDIWQKNSWVYQKDLVEPRSILINISASPYHIGKHQEREELLKNLARQTKAHVLYLNLVGGQDELVFDGGSMVVDSSGKIMVEAKRFEEDLLVVDVPTNRRTKWGHVKYLTCPHLSNAPKLGREQEIYRALVLGTKDYVRKTGFKKVLVGLSGGIDSALVARIAVDALGADNVVGVTMPSPYTSRETFQDAKILSKNLGIDCLEFRIDQIFKSYLKNLKPAFVGKPADSAEENLQARIRGNLLMALSNKFRYLVLTTGNKSEMATGYCTLYGDMAGGFAVIKDVPKTLVFRLARYRNQLSPKSSIPLRILKRPPTAELRPNQKDQDTLPPYSLLDRALELYVENDLSVDQIVKMGIPQSIARKVARMVDGNEYKRRQAPPGIKITPKAFGRDRRMPISNRYF